MSYNVDIVRCDLIRTNTSKSLNDIDELFLDWKEPYSPYRDEVKLPESYFNWDDDFINDLIKLAQIDIVGEIVIKGEEGEYIKFVLVDNEVKEYDGVITYSDYPHEIHSEVK